MAIENTIYDSRTLLGVFWDDDYMQPPANYWLNFFGQQINFDTEEIDLSKVSDVRKLAPLVVPTAQGKPIYSAAERRSIVKPAYVKPKDPVTASRMLRRQPGIGDLGRSGQPMSPQARYNAIVADIQRQHRYAIERRWEWMASEAIQNGVVTLEDEAYPRTLVDFGRDPSHTITLGAGSRWGDAGVSILGNLQTWTQKMRTAKFGGVPNRLTIGADVWDVMWADEEIRDFLNVQFRSNAGISLNLGIREGLEVEYVGKLSNNLEVYVYSDYYQDSVGTVVPFMNSKDIVLTGPGVRGVRCYGAILDKAAQFQPLPVFSKMWDEQDPSATFIMNQSAPLMVPVNPNATLRARVIG